MFFDANKKAVRSDLERAVDFFAQMQLQIISVTCAVPTFLKPSV